LVATADDSGLNSTDGILGMHNVTDLACALLELAASPHAGVHHVAGADAISRYELGVLIAQRDGLDRSTLPTGLRAAANLPGPIDVRLDCTNTQARLTTRLRGARDFLVPTLA
jgi:dTDP-4-dehydrorhamnose reductase